jgi:hypothetical protein
MKILTDNEKLEALLKKLEVAEEKLKFRLSHFRGVAHESDYVAGLRSEVETLKQKLGPKVLA